MKMLHRTCSKLLIKVWACNIRPVRYSALFINGARATENFVYIIPHIDFPEQFQQKEQIKEHLRRRKSVIDLNKLENLWSMYEELKLKKSEYDKKKQELSRELSVLMKNEPDSEAANKLKIKINLIKDNIRKLKAPLWSSEEVAIVEALKLPNNLNPKTPDGENKILYTHLTRPCNNNNHLKIGQELNIIHFKKNENYYFKGDAAVFELGAKFYFSNMLKKNKFVQFSNPDFVKSLIVEGCGKDHTNPDNTFILHHNEEAKVNVDSRLHLTGGASLCSYLAYHAKNVLYAKVLPLKYFTMGRQYIPSPSVEDSLFHVSQSSVIEFFGATKTANDCDVLLEELIEILKLTFSTLGHHYRMSILSADKLLMWESLRVVVEMYSTSLKSYVEIANVSLSNDFISKRLQFTYVENKQSNFPHIISGTLLNVPKFLGCVLEQDEKFSVPELFRPDKWSL